MKISASRPSPGGWLLAVLLAGCCALVLQARVYRDFERVRVRVVERGLASAGGSASVSLPDLSRLQGQATVIILSLANERAAPTTVTVLIDGDELGRVVVGPERVARLDFPVVDGSVRTRDGRLEARAAVDGWSIDYLEIANLHGFSSGAIAFAIVPAFADNESPVPGIGSVALFLVLLYAAGVSHPFERRMVRIVIQVMRAIIIAILTLALLAPLASDYKLLIAFHSFWVLALLLYLPALNGVLGAIGAAISDDSRFAPLKSQELWSNLRLSAASVLLSLLVLEVGVRIAVYVIDTDAILEDLRAEEEQAPVTGRMEPSRQTKLSKNPRIIYELRANTSTLDSFGNVHTTNRAGFRGPLIPLEKAPGTVRIVGLGDSFMYGYNVADDEIYLRLLSDRMNVEYPEVSWEIVNTAVGGYNTVMEVETLKDKGLAYDPDIVVIGFVGNDLGLPNFIRERRSLFEPESYLFDFVSGRGELLRSALVETSTILAADADDINWSETPSAAPPEYQDMVGVEPYRRAMRELADLRDEHGFELFILTRTRRDYVVEASEALDIPIANVRPKVDAFMAKHRIERWQGSILAVSDDDPHPSALGHRLYADALFEYMRDSGLIERAILEAMEPSRRTP